MSLANYIYLKIAAICLRFLARLAGKITSTPDERRLIPSRDPQRTIPVHIYKPTQQPSAGNRSPVLVNFHGSGFMIPAHGSDDAFCCQVCQQTDYTVVDVAYRLAPEHPFPAAHEDAEDAINWVLSQKQSFDISRVALSGFSAGANIILSLASTIYTPETFHSAIAFYPAVDWATDIRTKKAPNPNGQPIPALVLRLFTDALFQDPVNLASPHVSPLYADPEHFPDQVLIVTAEGDSLAPEAEKLADKLRERKTGRVVHFRAIGCSHAWDKMAREGSPEMTMTRHTYGLAMDMLNGK